MTDQQHRFRDRIHWDGTINVPTILSLLAMLGTLFWTGASLYASLDKRVSKNASDIALLESQEADAKQAAVESSAQVNRQLDHINDKLDRLIWDRGNSNAKVKDWQR